MNFFPIYSSPRRQQRLWCVIFFHPQNPSGVLQKEKKFPPLAIQRKHTASVYANVIKPRKKNIECLHTGHVVTWNRKCHESLHQHSGACTIPLNDPLFLFFSVASSACYWPLAALLLRSRSCVWLAVFRSGAELKMPNVLKEVDAIQRSELDIKRVPMTAKLLIQLKCHNVGNPPPNKTPFQMKKPPPPSSSAPAGF